jgi:hypothetical protein
MRDSIFLGLTGIEYFMFEEDFVEQHIRCIPMIVRFKMDTAGIKLKLSEWSRFNSEERIGLATRPCRSADEIYAYKTHLAGLIQKKAGNEAAMMEVDENPFWSQADHVPGPLLEKAREFEWDISVGQWRSLTQLQRFALIKLCRAGHENKNFPKAMREFGLVGGL